MMLWKRPHHFSEGNSSLTDASTIQQLGEVSICTQACPGLCLFLETPNATTHGTNQSRKAPRAAFDLPVL